MKICELKSRLVDMGLFDDKWVYFGHPVNLYGTEAESDAIYYITHEVMRDGSRVFNPSIEICKEGYETFREIEGKNGMDFYFDIILPEMKAGYFSPFLDGKFGMGVYGEAENLFNDTKPIFEYRFIDKNSLGAMIKPLELSNACCLSIDDTRSRIYVEGNRKNGFMDFFTGLPLVS